MIQIGFFIVSYLFGSLNPVQPSKNRMASQQAETETVYYLIRHAEKEVAGGEDPELSEKGKERVANWSAYFEDVSLDLIYSTKYNRTRQTAVKIAESQQLSTNYYDPQEIFTREFLNSTRGKKVLIVGHSNTNPAFANFVVQENRFPNLEENQYSALHILKVDKDGKVTAELLNI